VIVLLDLIGGHRWATGSGDERHRPRGAELARSSPPPGVGRPAERVGHGSESTCGPRDLQQRAARRSRRHQLELRSTVLTDLMTSLLCGCSLIGIGVLHSQSPAVRGAVGAGAPSWVASRPSKDRLAEDSREPAGGFRFPWGRTLVLPTPRTPAGGCRIEPVQRPRPCARLHSASPQRVVHLSDPAETITSSAFLEQFQDAIPAGRLWSGG